MSAPNVVVLGAGLAGLGFARHWPGCRVFEADGPNGQRFTLTEPWSVLLLDDARVIHETTPIQPQTEGVLGWRDTLVLTYRAGGFLGD